MSALLRSPAAALAGLLIPTLRNSEHFAPGFIGSVQVAPKGFLGSTAVMTMIALERALCARDRGEEGDELDRILGET